MLLPGTGLIALLVVVLGGAVALGAFDGDDGGSGGTGRSPKATRPAGAGADCVDDTGVEEPGSALACARPA
jgi:hypothetical protein